MGYDIELLLHCHTAFEGFSAARAAWCNQYVLHLAASAVIGQLSPDGMLACLLVDLRRDIPVRYLDQEDGTGIPP